MTNPDDEFRDAMARDRRVRPLRRDGQSPTVPTRPVAQPVASAPPPVPPTPPAATPPPAPAPPAAPADWQQQITALSDALRTEQEAHAQARAGVETLRRRLAALEAARVEAEATAPAAPAAPAPCLSLLDLLTAMKFEAPAARFADALHALRDTPLGQRVLAGLTVQHEAEVAHLMQDKVVWRCPACAGDAGAAVVIPVEPAACDVCGGSAVEAAAGHALARFRAHGCRKVLIVGGSPTYHAMLQRLLPASQLELRLMRGDHRLGAVQAASHVRWCDRGFIWAPTILDHAVSAVFTGPKMSTIPVRGIARFLLAMAEGVE